MGYECVLLRQESFVVESVSCGCTRTRRQRGRLIKSRRSTPVPDRTVGFVQMALLTHRMTQHAPADSIRQSKSANRSMTNVAE
jgi:hypothetical protein